MIVHVEGYSAAGDTLATLIKANIRITAEVRGVADDSVGRSQGKAVRVIDNRAAR